MMLSADRRGEVRVLALTVTFGNSTVKHCTRNARRVLSVCNRLDVSAAREGDVKSLLGGLFWIVVNEKLTLDMWMADMFYRPL